MYKKKCPDNRSFYDLDVLKKSNRSIDKLFQFTISHNKNLPKYYKRNSAFHQFNDITLQLVLDFGILAKSHIDELIHNTLQYGSLYELARMTKFNNINVDYATFPLIHQEKRVEIMEEIKSIASKFYSLDTLFFNITCLEILYFFALLVNPTYNWITIDYLSHGNKNHQYIINIETYSEGCKNKYL